MIVSLARSNLFFFGLFVAYFNHFSKKSPNLRGEWAEESFHWSICSQDIIISCNSLALFNAITSKIEPNQIIELILTIIINLKNRQLEHYKYLANEFIKLIHEKWFTLDFYGFDLITSISMILFSLKSQQLFDFGLELIYGLFNHESVDLLDYFDRVLPFIEYLFASTSPIQSEFKNKSQTQMGIDQLILINLFRGLERESSIHKTIWLLELFYKSLYPKIGVNNHILIAIILTYHVLAIKNHNFAIVAFEAIKSIGTFPSFPPLSFLSFSFWSNLEFQ